VELKKYTMDVPKKAKKLNVSKDIALPSHLYFQFESQSCHINAQEEHVANWAIALPPHPNCSLNLSLVT
jgi:hypothetical protein